MDTTFIYKDEDGQLTLDSKTGDILLRLATEKRIRNIGWLTKNTNGFISYYKNDEEKQVFKKANSWSINYNVFRFLPANESTINIRTERGIYRITKKRGIESGSFLYFKTSGIERKFYINRDFFTFEPHNGKETT